MEHKSLFTAFIVTLPVLFTVMYLYVPEFSGLEFHIQAIFAATASIFCVYLSYIFVLVIHRAAGIRYKPGYLFLLLGILIASSFLLLFPNNYRLGYGYAIDVFLQVYLYIYGSLVAAAFAARWVAKFIIYYFKNKGDERKGDDAA